MARLPGNGNTAKGGLKGNHFRCDIGKTGGEMACPATDVENQCRIRSFKKAKGVGDDNLIETDVLA